MQQTSRQDGKRDDDHALAQLERQVERGSLFTHTIVSRNADRILEAESFLYGLIDVLLDKGVVTHDEVAQSASKVLQEMEENGQAIGPGIALRIEADGECEHGAIPVDCAKRLHVCRAACCRLNFALTAEEIEAGRITWDLGAPYYIRQAPTGYCYHLDPAQQTCSIYSDRPGVCRRYSCVHDARIWRSYEAMQLNEEWLQDMLGESRPRLVQALMISEENLPGMA